MRYNSYRQPIDEQARKNNIEQRIRSLRSDIQTRETELRGLEAQLKGK